MAGGILPNGDSNQGINEINIIPLVDIMLVLLIIFMISTPLLMSKSLKVALPKAVNGTEAGRVTLNLMVNEEGKLLLDKKPISEDDLKNVIKELAESETPGDAIVSADKSVAHGRVLEVVDTLRSYGIREIGFGVLPKALK